MKSIKRNFAYNILLNVSSVIFPLVTAPYVSRVLEPDGIGLNNFAITYAGYFAIIALLGIPTYGVREVSACRDDKKAMTALVSELMSIACITTLIVSFAYFITISAIGQLTENYIIFLIAGFSVYLSPIKINWYFQGIEEFGYITFRSLVIRTISIICLFIFVHEKDDLVIYIILNVLGGLLADVWNFVKMWKSGIRPYLTFRGLRKHMSPLVILFTSSIAVSFYTVLDTLMLGFIRDYEEVGYYTNAMHISKIILYAVTSLSVVAVPRVSYYMKLLDYDKINDLINKSFSVISFLVFPIAMGLACISPTFVPLFYGQHFVGSVLPLIILSLLVISIGFNNLTGVQVLIGMGCDKLFLYSVLVGTFSNLLLNLLLIPSLGAVGASIASVASETLILVLTSIFVSKTTEIRINKWNDILKSFVGSLILIPIILLLNSFCERWILVILFGVVGGFCYLVIEYIFRNSSFYIFSSILINKIKK